MRWVVSGSSLRCVLLSTLAMGVLAAAAPPALAAGERPISLPAGSLEQSLAALSAQTGDQLLFPPDLVTGRKAPALSGRYTTEQALRRLLAEDDIEARRTGPRMVVLKPRPRPQAPPSAPAAAAREAPGERPFAEAGDAPIGRSPAPGHPPTEARTVHTVEEVRVTGTHIRGGSPAAPVLVMDREALQQTGHATLAGALQTLPQNFAGESTDATAGAVRADRQASNTGFATGVNLRGLGSDSTLVLVNGRRLAGSGNKGDFADISSLPAIAVERVEVLLDGASALYGSDAVGGVVNVILRREMDGGEIRVRGGGADREPREGLVGVALGHSWSDGGLLFAYEGYRREALPSEKRSFTRSADLRPLGGGDYRDTFSFPGNILRTNPATGTSEPFWGVPPGQPGTGLRPTDFQAGAINRLNQNAGVDVLPDQRRQVAYLTGHQALGRLEVSGDLRYAFRKVDADSNGATATLTVGRANPFFVSPTGAASHQLQFNFGPLVGPRRNASGVESLSASLGAELELPRDWRSGGYVAFAQEIIENRQSRGINALVLAEALGNSPDNPGTAYSPARDGFFNPFAGDARAYDPAVLAAITSGFSQARYKSQVRSANLQADGPLFSLPGGQVKAAVGAQFRRESFLTRGSNFSAALAPTPVAPFSGAREVAALYGEVRVPLVGTENGRAGLRRLELSAAVRGEHYSDFGRTVNPRFGAEWSPADGLTVRATYGESYRAPALVELYTPQIFSLVNATVGTTRVATLAKLGGNPDLGPETAKTWTLGLDVVPPQIPSLKLSATWFETRFDDRIDRPLVSAPRTAILTDPTLAPFVRRVSPATNAEDFAFVKALLDSPKFNTAFGVFQPTDFGAVTESGYVNTAGLQVQGLDVQATYSRDLLGGRLSLAANGSWLLDYVQTLTSASPEVELVGRVTYPARFRGRLTAAWSREGLSLGGAVNRTAAFRDPGRPRVRAQTTVDLNARIAGPDASWAEGTAVTLNVRNLFDRKPPFWDNPAGLAFDAANADVVGRFVAIQFSKAW